MLDTNVIVSAHLSPNGLERKLLRLAEDQTLELCVSQHVLFEYADVLARPHFALKTRDYGQAFWRICGAARLVTPVASVFASPDPTDNKFLECAQAANADYLITGNRRHFPKQWHMTRVLNARQFNDEIVPTLSR